MAKRGMGIAFIYIGAIIGAGFSSGQEIWHFFARHQGKGLYSLLITGGFFFFLAPILFRSVKKLKISVYHQYFYRFLPKPFSYLFDLLYSFFLLGSISVMLAGSGEVFRDLLGIPYFLGVSVTLIFILSALYLRIEGMMAINTILVPALLIITLATVLRFIFPLGPYLIRDVLLSMGNNNNWVLDAILYGSYNLVIAMGVMTEVIYVEEERDIIIGSIIGGIILLILGIVLYLGLITAFYTTPQEEIPLLFLARKGGKGFYLAYIIALYFAMVSTAIANYYAFSRRISKLFKFKYETGLMLTVLLVLPLVPSGFSVLVVKLYPFFGYLGMIYIVFFLLICFNLKKANSK